MADPRDWWIRAPDDWKPISSLPRKGGPFVLTNADKSKTWLSDGAKKRSADIHEIDGDDPTRLRAEKAADAPAFWAEP